MLLEKNGKNVVFNLRHRTDYSNKIEVFQEKNLQLQEGLKIIFTKNNKIRGLINSETAVIEKILDNHNNSNGAIKSNTNNEINSAINLALKFDERATRQVPLEHLKHTDYGYCITAHSAQGKTYDHTIAAISNNKLLATQKMWLVALSRHRSTFTALVEDKDKLKSYLMHNSGAVISAIELQSKIDSISKSDPKSTTNSGIIPKTNESQDNIKVEKPKGMSEMQFGG